MKWHHTAENRKKKNQDKTTKHFLCRQQDLKERQKQQAELAFVLSLEIIDEIKWLFLLSWWWVSKAETSQEESECPSLSVTSHLITARYRHFPPGSPLSKSLPWQRQAFKGKEGSLIVSPPNSPISYTPLPSKSGKREDVYCPGEWKFPAPVTTWAGGGGEGFVFCCRNWVLSRIKRLFIKLACNIYAHKAKSYEIFQRSFFKV